MPEIKEIELGEYQLIWEPTLKGQYSLYINRKKVRMTKPIYVKAGEPSTNSEIVIPHEIFQLEPSFLIIQLKDKYMNEITKLEYNARVGDEDTILLLGDRIHLEVTILNVNNGQEYTFTYSLNSLDLIVP